MRTVVPEIAILAALGAMAVMVALGWRLWVQVRRLGRDVTVAADAVATSSTHIASLLSGQSTHSPASNSQQGHIGD